MASTLSVLTDLLKEHLQGTDPTKVAIIAFVIGTVILGSTLFYVIGIGQSAFIGGVLPAAVVAIKLYEFVLDLPEDSTKDDNEEFRELANLVDELKNDLTDYRRVTRVLESRKVELDAVLEQTTGSHGIWIAFGDQKLDSDPDHISGGEIDDGNWVRYVLERDYDLVMVTPQSWLIPPEVVEREGLTTANEDELREWMMESVFGEFPGSTATIPLMSIVDLGRSYVKDGVEGAHMGTIPRAIIEDAETFTEDDLLNALSIQEVNLLEIVKSGEIVFFLPLDLTVEKTNLIRA